MTDHIPTHESRIARRSVLASIGIGTTALAGCTSGSSSDPSDDNSSGDDSETGLNTGESDVFESVEMNEEDLEIEVADDATIEFIDLVDPEGELYDQQRLESDKTETSFEILGRSDDFPTGEYELVALDDDESIDRTTITLEADCEITDVLWAAENPDMDWDKSSAAWDEHAAVVIKNTGAIPSLLTEIQWVGAPVARLQSTESQSYYHETHIPLGETTVYSAGPVYATEGAVHSLDCDELDTEPMTVTAVVQVGSNPSYTQSLEYGDEQSCGLTIVEGSADKPSADGGEN